MIVQPIAFVSFPCVVRKIIENLKVFCLYSRHRYKVIIIVILNNFAIRCCLLGSLKRTGTERDHCVYFMV